MTKFSSIRLLAILVSLAALCLTGCSRTSPQERPESAVELSSPQDGQVLSWADDADPSKFGFQLIVRGRLSDFSSMQGLSAALQMDDAATGAEANIVGSAFEFTPITLEVGTHRLTVKATSGDESASQTISVTLPELPENLRPSMAIFEPVGIRTYELDEDIDEDAEGFQIRLAGTLSNMWGSAGDLPVVTAFIDGRDAVPAPAIEVSASESSVSSFQFVIPALTVAEGAHAIQIAASLGTQAASATAYVVIPSENNHPDQFAVAIVSPSDKTIFTEADDEDETTPDFQTTVSGTLRGFGDQAELLISRNGIPLTNAAFRSDDGSYIFHKVTLPAGPNVIIITASEEIEGALVERSSLVTVTVPELSSSLNVALSAPTDGAILTWEADLDSELDGYQLNITGTARGEGITSEHLSLSVDGVVLDLIPETTAVISDESDDEDDEGNEGEEEDGGDSDSDAETHSEEDPPPETSGAETVLNFAFRNVTLSTGVHSIAVTLRRNGETASAVIAIAIPDLPPPSPSSEILEPIDGQGVTISAPDELAALDVRGNLDNAIDAVLLVDGKALNDIPEIDSGAFIFRGVQLAQGSHILQIQSSDGRYQSLSPAVTVHVRAFALTLAWPVDEIKIYRDESSPSGVETEIIGRIDACDECEGVPVLAIQLNGTDIEANVQLEENGTFRHMLQIAETGDAEIVVTAQQTLSGAEDSEGTSFSDSQRVTLHVLPSSERPEAAIAFTAPMDGSTLGWRDNESLSVDAFTTTLSVSVSNIQLGGAIYEFFVDGILAGTSGTSSNCALTTEGSDVTAFTCTGIDVSGAGMHVVRAIASLNDSANTVVEDHTIFTVPEAYIPVPPSQAVIAILLPKDGSALTWAHDLSSNADYQTAISGRLAGFETAGETTVSLYIDGERRPDACSSSGNTFACAEVTLTSGTHTIAVQVTGSGSNGLIIAASDAISVTVPEMPTLSLTASREAGAAATTLTASATGFDETATFKLETYVDGALASSSARDISELAQGLTIPDSELSLSAEPSCHAVAFSLIGTDGLLHVSALSSLLHVGTDCGEGPDMMILITSPVSGDVISVSHASSTSLTVTGSILGNVGEFAIPPSISMGGIPCTYAAQTQTFSCTGDFDVGEHSLIVTDTIHAVSSPAVAVTVQNSTGCPIALDELDLSRDTEGRFVFNRNTPGLSLNNSASGISGTYTFSGTTPAECAGGTISVQKMFADGNSSRIQSINILSDGSFAYKATLQDGEEGNEFIFSAQKPNFAPASGASVAYTADFTVPILVAAEGDTFDLSGEARTLNLLHTNDIRIGLKASSLREINSVPLGIFDITFTAKGLNSDPYALDTVTFSYDGSDEPLLTEKLQPEEAPTTTFTKSVPIPNGDWSLTLTLTDGSGNTSAQSFPIHVDIGCGVSLTSHVPGSIAVLAANGGEGASLSLSGISSCAGTTYAVFAGENGAGSCSISDDQGAFQCGLTLTQNAAVILTAPDASTQSLDVRLVENNSEIAIASPDVSAGGVVVVTSDNIHCENGLCSTGYVIDTDNADETGSLDFQANVALNDTYTNISCAYLLDGEVLSGQPCSISNVGAIHQTISFAQGTSGIFSVRVTGEIEEAGAPSHSDSFSFSFGITVASSAPAAPVVRLPGTNGASVTDCAEASNVTCISDRHQGKLNVWMNAPAQGITRTRGFVTGTKVSLVSVGSNTEAFTENTFKDESLMTWFSAINQGDGTELSPLSVTPMNFIHIGVQDVDAFGNRSAVTLVKSITMFWNHYVRTFAEENTQSALGITTEKGFSFGEYAATGDFNGDGISDAAVVGGTLSLKKSLLVIYYGAKDVGLSESNRDVIYRDEYLSALTAADIDHDGYDDIIAIYRSNAYAYYAAIYFGSATGLSSESKRIGIDYLYTNSTTTREIGFLNVRAVDDLNGDGMSDLVFSEALGTVIANPLTRTFEAHIFVVLTGEELASRLRAEDSPKLSSLATWQIKGAAGESFGIGLDLDVWNIFSIPDGDNAPALLIGAPGAQKAYFFHQADLTSCTPALDGCEAADVAAQVFSIPEGHEANVSFGRTMAVLDGNNDGVMDIYFGMTETRSNATTNQDNSIHVAIGSLGNSGIRFADPVRFNEENSALTTNFFAKNIRQANLLGDGYFSLIANTNSTVANRAYIYWNTASSGLSTEYGSIIEGPSFFGATIEFGDFNADGKLDLLFGASNTSGTATADPNGEFHVYY